MSTRIDHLVIAASSLAAGVHYVQQSLAVRIPAGGKHALMGTHNHLMQLGDTVFLEVLAIDPETSVPSRPRWYALDDPLLTASIEVEPRLIGWVVNTTNIVSQTAEPVRTVFDFGRPTLISRGNLSWHFALPDDGRLLAGGMLPYLIEWHTDTHPAQHMADTGCRLESLSIYHPYPVWLKQCLNMIDADALTTIFPLPDGEAAYLSARIRTPAGVRHIDSRPLKSASLQTRC